MNNKHWFVAGISFGAGLVVGYVAAVETQREKLREEYRQSAESFRAAMEMASYVHKDVEATESLFEYDKAEEGLKGKNIFAHTPDSLGADLKVNKAGSEIIVTDFSGEPVKNDYHKAVTATETGVEMFVDGGVNDYGVSYIEEEDFQDEGDGRAKHQIVIHMDEHNPIFMMGGIPIDDWDRRIGDSILVDFYKHVPPGAEPILYVRNHRTDEDYEVIRESP